jgi:hypothetical protein
LRAALGSLRRDNGLAVARWGPIAVMAVAAAFLWLETGGQSLSDDEWGYAARLSAQPLGEALFDPPPPDRHLIALPLLLYGALFEGFGIDSYAPIRVAWIATLLLCAGLFWVLVRRRVGAPLALLGMTLLLFLGSSWEVVASPIRLPSLIAIAAGLGAVLLLERRRVGTDVAASALLILSLLSHSTGLAFLAAAAALVWTRPAGERLRAGWVVALPTVAYAAWWVALRGPGDGPRLAHALELPAFVAGSAATVAGSVTGVLSVAWLQRGLLDDPLRLATVAVPGAIVAALLIWAVVARWRQPWPLPATLLAALSGLMALWIATGIAPGPDRVPWAARYLFPAAVFFLWALAELARGVRIPPRTMGIVTGVFAFALVANVAQLDRAAGDAAEESNRVRAALAALEAARGEVFHDFRPDDEEGRVLIGDLRLGALTAGGYFRIVDAYGTPAYEPADLASASPELQRIADVTLARASIPRLRTVTRGDNAAALDLTRPGGRPPPRPLSHQGARVTRGRGCVRIEPVDGPARTRVELPRGRALLIAAEGPPVALGLSRWGSSPSYRLAPLRGGTAARLSVPSYPAVPTPWKLSIRTAQRVRLCAG